MSKSRKNNTQHESNYPLCPIGGIFEINSENACVGQKIIDRDPFVDELLSDYIKRLYPDDTGVVIHASIGKKWQNITDDRNLKVSDVPRSCTVKITSDQMAEKTSKLSQALAVLARFSPPPKVSDTSSSASAQRSRRADSDDDSESKSAPSSAGSRSSSSSVQPIDIQQLKLTIMAEIGEKDRDWAKFLKAIKENKKSVIPQFINEIHSLEKNEISEKSFLKNILGLLDKYNALNSIFYSQADKKALLSIQNFVLARLVTLNDDDLFNRMLKTPKVGLLHQMGRQKISEDRLIEAASKGVSLLETSDGNTALVTAIASDNKKMAMFLIAKEKESLKKNKKTSVSLGVPDEIEGNLNTPLMLAIKQGWNDVAIDLIKSGKANINYAKSSGMTALHFASLLRMNDVVGALISAGADTNKVDAYGARPLDYYLYDPSRHDYCDGTTTMHSIVEGYFDLSYHSGFSKSQFEKDKNIVTLLSGNDAEEKFSNSFKESVTLAYLEKIVSEGHFFYEGSNGKRIKIKEREENLSEAQKELKKEWLEWQKKYSSSGSHKKLVFLKDPLPICRAASVHGYSIEDMDKNTQAMMKSFIADYLQKDGKFESLVKKDAYNAKKTASLTSDRHTESFSTSTVKKPEGSSASSSSSVIHRAIKGNDTATASHDAENVAIYKKLASLYEDSKRNAAKIIKLIDQLPSEYDDSIAYLSKQKDKNGYVEKERGRQTRSIESDDDSKFVPPKDKAVAARAAREEAAARKTSDDDNSQHAPPKRKR